MEKKLRILAAGDLHGNKSLAEKLSKKAIEEKVDLIILTGDLTGPVKDDGSILEPFTKAKQKVVFIPGNWESSEEVDLLKKRAKNIHNYYVTYNEIAISGIGNPDWKMRLDKEDLYAIKSNFSRIKSKKRILVSHLHAEGTLAEFSGIPGDKILREAVEYFKPDMLISSHIHEAEGLEDFIGKTKVFQVGRTGKVLEI